MIALAGVLPKVAVFVLAAAVGGSATLVGTGVLRGTGPVDAAVDLPEYQLAGDTPADPPAAFDLGEVAPPPALVPGLPSADLSLAAATLLGNDPIVEAVAPLGFPRIDPISQFDGGPFANANCTLAAGAMLARLGFGIVTTGTILRTLQDDQVGGTGLDDLQVALWRGYGVAARTGLLTPTHLKRLLAAGYGAVIQGVYGQIPAGLRLQPSFEGPHAIFLDGYYPGGAGIPEAYYVVDPLGRPHSGYRGDWWPASIVDAFGTAFGGGRMAAAWVFPPGGVPPEVLDPDVLPLPPSGGADATPSPAPSGASTSPGASASPGGSPSPVFEPGDLTVLDPVVDPGVSGGVTLGGLDLLPFLAYCLGTPVPIGCPGGIPAVFEAAGPAIPAVLVGPTIDVRFVDSDQPGRVLVGFALDPPGAPADVRFWESDGSPAIVHGASSMSSLTLLGQTLRIAVLDVAADTDYHFQVVAGDGAASSASPVGTFHSGDGVVRYEVSLSQTATPDFRLGTGLSPYRHLDLGGLAPPLVRLDGGSLPGCTGSAEYGGVAYCLELPPAAPLAPGGCTVAGVSYELAGIDASGVLVRAFPTVDGVLPDGTETLAGVLEAAGPAGEGEVSIGCLASGLSYALLLDAVGDDRGPLAVEVVAAP